MIRLIRGCLSPDLIKAVFVFVKRLSSLQKTGGLKFVALYCKACHIYTMQFIASGGVRQSFITSTCYGVNVSLTSGGLPRILPNYLRRLVTSQNKEGIKIVLTLFNLYRVLPYPGKVKLNTITDE